MIQVLATNYCKSIAVLFLIIFECSFIQARSTAKGEVEKVLANTFSKESIVNHSKISSQVSPGGKPHLAEEIPNSSIDSTEIGGPNQPEMSSFKSIGTDNMVNLFTGDFSYNIPLLDVGGYPVNIFYDGGVSSEQDASWVGLGWNINPGSVNRNMRGIPDDFNGSDILKQTQQMKPNITWGFTGGYDLELVGIKDLPISATGSLGASLDLSFNNYLGPAMGVGLKGSTNIKLANIGSSEKGGSIGIGGGINANINSRSGLTLAGNVSLTATAFKRGNESMGFATRLGTSYNSRSGIKALQLSEQMSYNYSTARKSASVGISNSSTISFAKPSYIPSIRMAVSNEAYSGRFQLGNALFGVYGSGEVEVYKQISRVAQPIQSKPLVGYIYYHKALDDPNAVMDFTRLNDNEVTPSTQIISAPQYTYDVFSVQGEGTGGTIRAYRDDMGYVRDNTTRSQDKSGSAGADIGIPGHYGANFNIIKTPTVISEWDKGNKLRDAIKFKESNELEETVYFRNPGETSVLSNNQFNRIGGTDLVRYKIQGDRAVPTIEPVLERFQKSNVGVISGITNVNTVPDYQRKKRTQVTTFLTAEEVSDIGLDKKIKSYLPAVLDNDNNLIYESLNRYYTNDPELEDTWRRAHHISQLNVTEANGRRYVYGIPVYNIKQKDFTFSVDGVPTGEEITFSDDQVTKDSELLTEKTIDGFVQITETPAYAQSFLLTGLLSADFVDVNGDGITEDDLGDAVKFNYTKYKDHQWRTPLSAHENMANFSGGNRSETKDDKGLVSWGKRESWYLHSIESKTMIALFTVEDRKDGKGVGNEQSGMDQTDNSQKRLKKIDLYSKSDLKKNGLTGAKPIKTVWFVYSYKLAAESPGNNNQSEIVNGVNVNSNEGKLTLEGIYFTFNGKERNNKNKYVFSYTGSDGSGNPVYIKNASDRWGSYKPAHDNPALPTPEEHTNADFPYSVQEKVKADQNAGAWALKKILLPSGAQIEVEYESDDYAFVQNKRAATMMKIVGVGKDENSLTNTLYRFENGIKDNFYVLIEVPDANVPDIQKAYLQDFEQLALKLAVKMPKGLEYVNCYANIDFSPNSPSFGKSNARNDNKTIWIRLKPVRDGLSPLTLSVLDYLREQLPGQAFKGYDVSESTGLKQIVDILEGMHEALKSSFKDPVKYLRSEHKAQSIVLERSFIRLTDHDGYKFGGGQRVKSVVLKDNWTAMTGQYTSTYGQKYEYQTTENFNGVERTISSGVASYEPSIGGEENPFFSIIQTVNEVELGPASYGAVEMPMLDAFFPAPVVGYSKITVRSIQHGSIAANKKSRSGIGKQVTEFYTAKDFPVYYSHTTIDPESDKTYHKSPLFNFFYKYTIDTRAISQGFLVETNDMHGKLKSQSSYAEGDEKTRISYTENFYRNTGIKGLEEKFDFIYGSKGGEIEQGNMGIDIELMTDTREFSVKSSTLEVQGQLDLFPVFGGLPWLPFLWTVSGSSENTYRAVTTTKIVNYHGILDRVVVIDKGSMITTKNMVYDAETGDVVINSTQNEFDKPVYSINYPAYWAYSGMGLAYKNIDAVYTSVNFLNGTITSGIPSTSLKDIFESGDEIYIMNPGTATGCDPNTVSAPLNEIIWAVNKNKNISSLTDANPAFIFIDHNGRPYNRNGVKLRIIRSGKRNMLTSPVAALTVMADPILTTNGVRKLSLNNTSKVINASAVEYKEKWQVEGHVIQRYKLISDEITCPTEVEDCDGYLDKSINPYGKGLLGNFKSQNSKVYYGNRAETNPLAPTNIAQNGFLGSDFQLYWNFNVAGNLEPVPHSNWVWNTQSTRFNSRGLELETKDANEIYTAAQYGYNNTMPVAIAGNSRNTEMMYESFEDWEYSESLNGNSLNSCSKRRIDFSNSVSSDEAGIQAHSGNSMMSVSGTVIKDINIGQSDNLAYDLIFGEKTNTVLSDEGVNKTISLASPSNVFTLSPPEYVFGGPGAYVNVKTPATDKIENSIRSHQFNLAWEAYVEVKESKIYSFSISIASLAGSSDPNYPNNYINRIFILKILDLDGNVLKTTPLSSSSLNFSSINFSFKLCSGMYKIRGEISESFSVSVDGGSALYSEFSWNSNIDSKVYKTLSTANGCTYKTPIVGSETMLHPKFSIKSGKKMLFSGWVYRGNNNNCKVQFSFDNVDQPDILPTGPIIEGWQRLEGIFTIPANATTAKLKLINEGSQPVYFDDIRIHPFNSNMKSYVYDPLNLRLTAELDANNYATFYEYDEEGSLIRTKVETKQGVKTINETRSFKQTSITQVQQ